MPLVLWTWDMRRGLATALRSDRVQGCLSKELSGPSIIHALQRLGAGEHVVQASDGTPYPLAPRDLGLTWREYQTLTLITSGLSNVEIADSLGISMNTVKSYIRSAYRKAGVATRAKAVRWGLDHHCTEKSRVIGPSARSCAS